ncbi:hypothetical protein HKX48_004774 [Thoreauomyces humboldtii]|nr:hypothetical protein HKX48_004774 [Thoreauomyces humboldtii]
MSTRRASKLPPPLDTALTRSPSLSAIEVDTSSKQFTRALASVVDATAMTHIVTSQEQTYVDTVATMRQNSHTLERFNETSAIRYTQSVAVLTNHTHMLKDMKADLDIVFRRIRALKAKVATQYPKEYEGVAKARAIEEEELDVE